MNLENPWVTSCLLKRASLSLWADLTERHRPANKGVLVILGVLRPRALLAITPRSGLLSGATFPRNRKGVPAGEPKKSGIGGGASGKDCSPWVLPSICTSSEG